MVPKSIKRIYNKYNGGLNMGYKKIILLCFIIYILIVSLITFIEFGKDKKKAIKGLERTKEKTLLFLSAFGGSFGAFFGRNIFHHKTDKKYFSLVIYSSIILNIVLIILFVWRAIL
jgi:uncharacterized membrane protein YsdA (DUF1294 family)